MKKLQFIFMVLAMTALVSSPLMLTTAHAHDMYKHSYAAKQDSPPTPHKNDAKTPSPHKDEHKSNSPAPKDDHKSPSPAQKDEHKPHDKK